jgi:hypothetical protein
VARIRTVKPELFRHEELHNAEKAAGLPLRLAYIGLFTVADREGRFRWRPRQVQLDVMPWDKEIDFEAVMDELAAHGFIEKYEHEGEHFGWIPSFRRHQVINAREKPSNLPDPKDCAKLPTRGRLEKLSANIACGEGKGREKEGEEEGKGRLVGPRVMTRKPNTTTQDLIATYCEEYKHRKGTNPVIDGANQAAATRAVKALGLDRAKSLIPTYLDWSDQWFVKRGHDLITFAGNLNRIVEKHDTGRVTTSIEAKHAEQGDFYRNQLERIERGEL